MSSIRLHININPSIYCKDPTLTELGQKILNEGLLLLDELGIEDFSFRKLANQISSTESSIYRYFTNKHYLFVYMLNWYWEWISTRIDIGLININDPELKLKKIIRMLIESSNSDAQTPYINEEILHRVVVREGSKAYRHILVDHENQDGFFLSYKGLCAKIADVILEINPSYKYPKSLASMLVETSNNNLYFAKHLPRLTDLTHDQNIDDSLWEMLYHFAFCSIQQHNDATLNKIKRTAQYSEH